MTLLSTNVLVSSAVLTRMRNAEGSARAKLSDSLTEAQKVTLNNAAEKYPNLTVTIDGYEWNDEGPDGVQPEVFVTLEVGLPNGDNIGKLVSLDYTGGWGS